MREEINRIVSEFVYHESVGDNAVIVSTSTKHMPEGQPNPHLITVKFGLPMLR